MIILNDLYHVNAFKLRGIKYDSYDAEGNSSLMIDL